MGEDSQSRRPISLYPVRDQTKGYKANYYWIWDAMEINDPTESVLIHEFWGHRTSFLEDISAEWPWSSFWVLRELTGMVHCLMNAAMLRGLPRTAASLGITDSLQLSNEQLFELMGLLTIVMEQVWEKLEPLAELYALTTVHDKMLAWAGDLMSPSGDFLLGPKALMASIPQGDEVSLRLREPLRSLYSFTNVADRCAIMGRCVTNVVHLAEDGSTIQFDDPLEIIVEYGRLARLGMAAAREALYEEAESNMAEARGLIAKVEEKVLVHIPASLLRIRELTRTVNYLQRWIMKSIVSSEDGAPYFPWLRLSAGEMQLSKECLGKAGQCLYLFLNDRPAEVVINGDLIHYAEDVFRDSHGQGPPLNWWALLAQLEVMREGFLFDVLTECPFRARKITGIADPSQLCEPVCFIKMASDLGFIKLHGGTSDCKVGQ